MNYTEIFELSIIYKLEMKSTIEPMKKIVKLKKKKKVDTHMCLVENRASNKQTQ